MESGGKAVTKRYRKKITVALSLVLPVIVLFAILNCFTTYVFYEGYKYKMNLMTEIAAKEEFSGLDAVSELLKDKDIETNEQGRQLLEQYGYWENGSTSSVRPRQRARFLPSCAAIHERFRRREKTYSPNGSRRTSQEETSRRKLSEY